MKIKLPSLRKNLTVKFPVAAARNGKPAKPLPPYDDKDTYENQPASFRAQNNNRLTEEPALNYEQVEFDKRKGQARPHPRESPVQYVDFNFPKRK